MKIEGIKSKIIITLAIMAGVAVMYFFSVPCPILALTGIPCPGCGMTRALTAALTLRFADAFSHHLMFWSVPVLYLFFLFDGRLFKSKAINALCLAVLAAGFAVNWAINII